MESIRAMVHDRLLSKADRLFDGTLSGRIIEVLQNARRAGATRVEISNRDGLVTIHDNGGGIEDPARLLNLGSSGWNEDVEAAEDPAGVGVFSLAPRSVTVRSRGLRVTIEGNGWTGSPVPVQGDPDPAEGTLLEFQDEPWTRDVVNPHAVFCGMVVVVDGETCDSEPFVSDRAVTFLDLGCRIEVVRERDLDGWHLTAKRDRFCRDNVLVNFFGQVVTFFHRPVSHQNMHFLVDLTGAPTGIRLMLPARTCLVENDALKKVREVLQRQAYEFVRRCGSHSLSFDEYRRGRELGFDLPEATPAYEAGLLYAAEFEPEPVPVEMPAGLPLSACYRMGPEFKSDADEVNVHLLGALGRFQQTFIPVMIHSRYDGYSWARLPLVESVEVSMGRKLHEAWIGAGRLTCVDGIRIAVRCSDGRTFASPVCMAVDPEAGGEFSETECVLVTPDAEGELLDEQLWHHLGGPDEDGDTYETQFDRFQKELGQFWAALIGPDEFARRNLIGAIDDAASGWSRVVVTHEGTVVIEMADASVRHLEPPSANPAGVEEPREPLRE